MLECCLQHLTVPTRVQWLLQFESSNIKFSSRAGNAMWILRSLALARIRESKHKVSFQEITISFWLSLALWSANICASYCLWEFKNNLQFWSKSSKMKVSQQQYEYSLHLNNETCGHCAVFAQNDFWGRYLPNTFSNLINDEQLLSSECNRSSKQTCRWDFFLKFVS